MCRLDRFIILLLVPSLACSSLSAQQDSATKVPFSESRIYTPRDAEKKDKQKKDQDKKLAEPVGPANRDSVTIPVTVRSPEGRLVSNLTAADFEVQVDGKPVTIRELNRSDGPLDVLLLLDLSPSTSSQRDALKRIATRVVSKFRPEDRITVARFNDDLKIVQPATADRTKITKAIQNLSVGDGTAFYNAIGELFDKLVQDPNPNALIVITDGVDTVSRNYTYQSSLLAAERHTTRIFVVYLDTYYSAGIPPPGIPANQPPGTVLVGVVPFIAGPSVAVYHRGAQYLADLIDLSGGRPIRADNVLSGQNTSIDTIPYELANQYYLTISAPPNRTAGTRHTLKVRVARSGVEIYTKGSLID